uniref:Uncharacterized protein n=1 Tax=Arundo donax TaxID=35708 RepID=A0A0A8Y6N8_ARUDO
MNNLLLRSCR